MIQTIIGYLNEKLGTLGRINATYCLTERRKREGDGANIPYSYTGAGEYQAVDIDNGSSSWWRGRSGFSLEPVTVIGRAVKQQKATFPLRVIVLLRREDSTADDSFMPARLAEDVASVLNFENGDLRTFLGAYSVAARASGGEYDTTKIWNEEFQTSIPDLDYKLCMVAVDVTIEVVADYSCWVGECDTDPDILHYFNFCNAGTVARLTPTQVACLVTALCDPPPCPDAAYNLIDTDSPPNVLSSGTIASGGTEDIVAPNAAVLRDGVAYGVVPSGGTIDVISDCPPCAIGSVTVNTNPFGTVASGGAIEVPVVNSLGAPVAAIVAGQVVVGNSTVTINGVTVATPPAQTTVARFVTLDGVQAGSFDGVNTWEVVSPTAVFPTTAFPFKTGATVSNTPNDDGDGEWGRSRTTLDWTNPFGNTNRFTDSLGTQVYANGIVIDFAQGDRNTNTYLVLDRLDITTNRTFDNHCAYGLTKTTGGLSGWHMCTMNEMLGLQHWGVNQSMSYAPFNFNTAPFFWLSTAYFSNNATTAWIFLTASTVPVQARGKILSYPAMFATYRTF